MATVLQELRAPRWKVVESEAERLTKIYSAPPIPALEIAERSGVDVLFAKFGDATEKVAGFCDFPHAKLYVNSEDIVERQTFTIAHELGHWILHKDFFEQNPEEYEILPRFQSVDEHDPFEKEANFFAASLLVPKRLLLPVKDAPVSQLARAFGVSRTMMEYRLQNLDILLRPSKLANFLQLIPPRFERGDEDVVSDVPIVGDVGDK